MMYFGRRQARPIGLDVGQDGVKMLQLAAPGRAPAVVAASLRFTDAGDSAAAPPPLSETLAQMLAEAPFVGRRVTAALPGGIVHTRTLRIAPGSSDLEETARAEAEGLFPFDLRQATVRFLPAGLVRQGSEMRQEVIVFAARNDEVTAFLAQLQAAGLTVQSLQLQQLAAYHCARQADDASDVHAVLDIGASRSTLVIGKAGVVTFLKSIDIGGGHIRQAVGHKLGLDDAEVRHLRRRLARDGNPASLRSDPVASAVFDASRALAESLAHQVAMCFRYHAITFRGQRPAHLALLGGDAPDPNLQSALGGALSIPVQPIAPLAGIDTHAMRPADYQPPAGEWGVAVGLNLIPGVAAGGIGTVKAAARLAA